MIETKFIKEIVREFQISEFISESLNNVGFSQVKVNKTPLGEKIIIYASRPGLVVGRKGENIQKLTKTLKSKFKLENPQIEIIEVEQPMLDPNIVAERIASSLERFGSSKFKGIGHKMLSEVMDAGAQGIEIIISGKIPSSRARRWRFYQGYLKKSGDIAVSFIKKAYAQAKLKTGVVGIQIRIMPPDLVLPDTVTEKSEETIGEELAAEDAKKKPKKKSRSSTKKKSSENKKAKAKTEPKTEEKVEEKVSKEVEEVKAEPKTEEKVSKEVEEVKAEPKTEEKVEEKVSKEE